MTCPSPNTDATTNTNDGTTTTTPRHRTTTTTTIAKLVPPTATSLDQCAARLKSGNLVAFPTETVYGLGCNALDPTAIDKIYAAKGRPKTNPLIVHVRDATRALELWDATTTTSRHRSSSSVAGRVLRALTDEFFPGPLTLVAAACASIPEQITAGTGYVAVRAPSHEICRALLCATGGLPVAAPSANKYGHVSPTTARHVMRDLREEDVWVIDGGGCCVGVESTVARVVE
eukprot:CAMPEP_0172509510 /NCGR_PEP_ID=MMETSP1066-20121228/220919_1 /TAXON_ID=671091 /ORGANISM="Coscinodiscus wailesii, Strain CCMP2513" /LENGTH=230 /DNA_ID=CAMNT_0013288027 /DNA_START=336 /DNA_END=1025 /DNA_ORIENTATION=+